MGACGLNPLMVYFNVKFCDIWEGKRDDEEWDSSREHPLSRDLGYKWKSGFNKVDIMDLKV